jgi:hypothetical protein
MPRVARCAWSVCTECGSGQIPPKRLNATQRGPEWPPQWEPGAPCPNKFPCHNVIQDKWRTRWFCSSAFPGVTLRPEYDWCWVLSSVESPNSGCTGPPCMNFCKIIFILLEKSQKYTENYTRTHILLALCKIQTCRRFGVPWILIKLSPDF